MACDVNLQCYTTAQDNAAQTILIDIPCHKFNFLVCVCQLCYHQHFLFIIRFNSINVHYEDQIMDRRMYYDVTEPNVKFHAQYSTVKPVLILIRYDNGRHHSNRQYY